MRWNCLAVLHYWDLHEANLRLGWICISQSLLQYETGCLKNHELTKNRCLHLFSSEYASSLECENKYVRSRTLSRSVYCFKSVYGQSVTVMAGKNAVSCSRGKCWMTIASFIQFPSAVLFQLQLFWSYYKVGRVTLSSFPAAWNNHFLRFIRSMRMQCVQVTNTPCCQTLLLLRLLHHFQPCCSSVRTLDVTFVRKCQHAHLARAVEMSFFKCNY